MPTQYVTFTIEITARVDCEMERSDYGVPRSPVFYEPNPDTFEVSGLEVYGHGVDINALPKNLKEMIEDEAIETATRLDGWE